MDENLKMLSLNIDMYGVEILTVQKVDQKYLKELKCAAREGCRRSFGPIVC
jgi:hypothetical protein